ncbi:MAG: relaxase domain-containing protein [Deferribacteraceae bacterium]|jgi:conjugative relaxase-like TrwC/TraI family protein|nr:relaxase domain-containing protein [Deferribacteraceae bacterium]
MGFLRGTTVDRAGKYYYEKDIITAPDGKGANSEWYGKIAVDLGLEGRVERDRFNSIIRGDLLETKQRDHRAGIDFTLSPPKSVSLMALHYGDNRLIEAQKAAVNATLKYIEDNFMQYRYTELGHTITVPADKMLAATFMHSTSRANDPQLHTHAIIMNLVDTENGYRALSNELLYENQALINNIYQNYMAHNVQELGYKIKQYSNKFEIDGVSKEAIKLFSKRTESIEERAGELYEKMPHLHEAELRDMANFDTREGKVYIPEEVLRSRWESEFAKDELYKNPSKSIDIGLSHDTMLDKAIETLAKSEMSFSTNQLLSTILSQNRGKIKLEEAQARIKSSISKDIIEIAPAVYSTPALIELENKIVANVKIGRNSKSALLPNATDHINQCKTLTLGQKRCLEHILTTTDRVSVVQGDAGTGKTFVIDKLRETLEVHNIDMPLRGVGFTGKAAQELATAAKIETSTIASYLNKSSHREEILIVDESSMVSSVDMLKLLESARNNRIIFVGDGKQLPAIGAGKMFKELQRENIVQTVEMKDVLRQKTELAKAVVSNISSYQEGRNSKGLAKAIELLAKNECVKLCDDLFAINSAALAEYKSNSDAIILTSTRAEKHLINAAIRRNIHADKESTTFMIRESRDSSSFATDYQLNDIVYHKNKSHIVRKVDEERNIITISCKGKSVMVNTMSADLPIYREAERQFTAGEKIIFLKNDYGLKVQNGLVGTVEKIDQSGNFFVNVNDQQRIFNIKDYPYIDYAYAQTITKSQGATYDKAVLVGSNITTEAFYTAASRCKSEFKIITSDLDRLTASIHREQEKTSTRSVQDSAKGSEKVRDFER